MRNKKQLLLLLGILLLAIFLRFYKLAEIPNGFNQDESAIGYNAYSILNTGKDEHGLSFPLYFKSFGDQKLPVYIYITALSEAVFGVNEFAVRFPSAFLGSLTVLLTYFLIKAVSSNNQLALVGSFFLALNPWHLFFSRAAFEVNAALSFVVFGSWMFLLGVNSGKLRYYFIAVVGFAFSLYSYNVTRLLAPLLLLTLIIIYWKKVKKIPRKMKVIFVIFSFFLLSPFILTFFSPAGASSASGALLTSADIQAKNVEIRSYLATASPLMGKLLFNKWVYTGWQYLENIVGTFSVPFFFLYGSSHGSQGIGNVGMFYVFEFFFMITGIVFFIKNKEKKLSFFFAWAVITLLVLSLSKEVPHATRGYFLVLPLTVFSAAGLLAVTDLLKRMKPKKIQYSLCILLVLLISYNLIYYFVSYYLRFPVLYAKNWRQQDKSLALYLKENENKYEKIIIDKDANFIYTSFLFATHYSPEAFQKSAVRDPDDSEGFSAVRAFGKYVYKEIDWSKDLKQKKTLLVTSETRRPSNIFPHKKFFYPNRPIVLVRKERIEQYPVEDVAYVVIKTP